MFPQPLQKSWFFLLAILPLLLLCSCAVNPPVQEMSNARQSIQSAYEVKAQIYAPVPLKQAVRLLKEATDALDAGDYPSARGYAIAAQHKAIKARQEAQSNNKAN